MPLMDDNEVEVMSSDTSQILDDANATAEATADSSTANGDSSDDLLSVARDVIKEERKKAEEAASPAEGEEEEDTKAEVETARKEPDNEAFSDVPFHKHPRFKQLLTERNGLREDATRYRNVQTFLDNNGLGAEEAAEALVIAGLIRNQPQEAWKRLQPVLQNLLIAAGEVLPPDLHQLVQSGQMTEQAALEVSRSRAGVQAVQHQRESEQQRYQRQQVEAAGRAIFEAASTWEGDRRQRDPNFEAKMPAIQREIAFMHATEGKPNTPMGVKDQLDRAYKAVSKQFRPATPPPQPKREIKPVMGGQAVNASKPAPTTTLEVIRSMRSR